MPIRLPSSRRLFPLFLAVVLFGACQPGGDSGDGGADDEAAKNRVGNAEIGVAIADLDPFFEVRSNQGAEIVLVPAAETEEGEPIEGELTIRASEPKTQGGVNLVAAVENHELALESRPNGEFSGQRELGGPLGTAFYSRGRFDAEDGTRMEETVIFTLHPAGDRRLELAYVYPAGDDSQARVQDQLFSVFGEIVPMETAEDAAAGTASEEAGTDGGEEASP